MITKLQRRIGTFLIGCIGTRIGLAYAAKFSNKLWSKILSIVTGTMSLGFATIFIFGLRKTGLETQGAPIWWNHLRPLHAIMYGVASWGLFVGNQDLSWKVLLLDTFIGLVAFLHYHYNAGSFE